MKLYEFIRSIIIGAESNAENDFVEIIDKIFGYNPAA